MKCKQSRPGFELVSPCLFPATITIAPRAPQLYSFISILKERRCKTTPKNRYESYRPPHISLWRCSVLKRKISMMKILYIMFISRIFNTLLRFWVTSFTLNNCFNPPVKICIQILYHLHRYEMPFSVAELLQVFNIAWILGWILLFGPCYICLRIFKLGLKDGRSFNTVAFSSTKFCCVVRDPWHRIFLCWKKSHFHPSLVWNCSTAIGCIWQ